ncbi:MAG: response regulator [Clostridia bacterium]|nr:response regulator [Clostridia bacterium]
MRIICIDDEPLILNMTVELCEKLPQGPEVVGFTKPGDALVWLNAHSADVALLDINMPGMSGLELAARIRELDPTTAIIFLTGYSEYAVDAFKLHASGYLMKPVNKQRLAEEIAHAAKNRGVSQEAQPGVMARVSARTFGEFDIFVDGKPLSFPRSKSKELLAYLIDRQGGGITRAAAAAVLWEDEPYDRSMQKQLDVIIRSLRTALESVGAQDIFELKNGVMRILPEKIDCDLFRFLSGDSAAVNSYRGEYMNAYSWASFTEAFLERTKNRKNK